MSAMATIWRTHAALGGRFHGREGYAIATPEKYGLNPVILTMAQAIAEKTGATLNHD